MPFTTKRNTNILFQDMNSGHLVYNLRLKPFRYVLYRWFSCDNQALVGCIPIAAVVVNFNEK